MSDDHKPEPEELAGGPLQLPEVKPVMHRRLKSCFDHGKRMTSQDRPDFDYANTMFTECVVKSPGNYEYLVAFFDNLCRKYNNNKKGARIKVYGSSKAAFKKALGKKEWLEVLQIGPELLKVNPWDSATLEAMAQACEQFRPALNDQELKYLNMALQANPKDLEINKHCARSLARMGQHDQAIACWRRVEEVKKNDPEAQRTIAQLMMDKTRPQAGIDDDDLSDEEKAKKRRDRAEAASAAVEKTRHDAEKRLSVEKTAAEIQEERRKKIIPLSPRQKLEQAIRDNPLDVDNHLGLAELHEQEGRLGDVKATIQRAIAAVRDDIAAQDKIVAFESRDVRRKAAAAEKKAREEPSPQAEQLAKRLAAELHQRELELYTDRAERFPDFLAVKYELALRLKRVGRFDEAVKYFADAEKDPGTSSPGAASKRRSSTAAKAVPAGPADVQVGGGRGPVRERRGVPEVGHVAGGPLVRRAEADRPGRKVLPDVV